MHVSRSPSRARPAALALAASAFLGLAAPRAARADMALFSFTGTDQFFTVPLGVTSLAVALWGAGGGGDPGVYSVPASGGGGAFVSGDLAVTPGKMLTV
ncbi:MAG: hypothetical protein JO250_09425, partial [Armatimonadetes bacterium]|nr:hypothetical protein [Armatimonadota bacterium]